MLLARLLSLLSWAGAVSIYSQNPRISRCPALARPGRISQIAQKQEPATGKVCKQQYIRHVLWSVRRRSGDGSDIY